MPSGRVKWFNNAKGYGFILPDEGGEDLFAHYSAIVMDGYKTLKAGEAVEFDLQPGDKGTHAVNIRATAEASRAESPRSSDPAADFPADGAEERGDDEYDDTLSRLERAERTRRIADQVRETFASRLDAETSDTPSDR